MWTHYNLYSKDDRFNKVSILTEKEKEEAMEYFKERKEREKRFRVVGVKR